MGCPRTFLRGLPLRRMEIFPGQSLLLDEFGKIRQLAVAECCGRPAAEVIEQEMPGSDFVDVLGRLEQTDEMRKLIADSQPFPSDAYPDLRDCLKLLRVRNAMLSVGQVLEIRRILERTAVIHAFFKTRAELYPLLASVLSGSRYDADLLSSIDVVMDEVGVVRSSASSELASIRKQLGRKRAEVEQIYQSALSRYRKSGWLSDAQESWRNGRRVVSIQAEQKRTAKGIIHDISATGKTCFIEPEEAIPYNNLIQSLEEEERQEILRILRALSDQLRNHHEAISLYFDQNVRFDRIAAKARLALKMRASLPFVEPIPMVHLIDASHPLLFLKNIQSGKKTVPFSLDLGGDSRILVISGPNAGGKTVCLKTVGLLQLMLQAGYLVTADGNSRFGLFSHLLVDIGDSQSLEFELSTYSSRLRHMKEFVSRSGERTLFLIDEFGTGTDPALGGALAEAILEELNYKRSFGIITTHYMNLKVLADRTNGSMAFDARRLEPMYKLEVGKPGSSYTFVVAERSGLPHSVINKARKKVKKNTLLLEELLNKLEREKSEVARLLEVNRNQEKRLQELVGRYERNVVKQEQREVQDTERVRQKELRLSRQLEDRFQRFVKDWKESRDKKAVLHKYTRKLDERKNELSAKEQIKQEELVSFNRLNIRKGVSVRLKNGKVYGQVDSRRGDRVIVLFGNVKTTADIKDLVVQEEKAAPEKQRKSQA